MGPQAFNTSIFTYQYNISAALYLMFEGLTVIRTPRRQLERPLISQHKSVQVTPTQVLPIAFSLPSHVSTNQPISVCLCKISSTPQCASSFGGWGGSWNLGSQAEHEHTTAACWNNRAAEMTAPRGSYYPLGL